MSTRPRQSPRSARWATTRIAVLLLSLSLAAAACGSSGAGDASRPTTVTNEPERGWIDGSPREAERAFLGERGEAADAEMTKGATYASTVAGSASEPDGDAARLTLDGPVDSGPPRAGSIDDNESFDDYLAYLGRIAELGVPVRTVDISSRHRVTVTGTNGLPVAGVPVEVRQGDAILGSVRTGADGVALLHPSAMSGWTADDDLVVVANGIEATLDSSELAISIDRAGGVDGAIALDVLFLIDATGSMGDEIERLKETVDEVARRASALDTPIDLRLALTVYRDEGDAFVTRTFDFTGDVTSFQAALDDVTADGGGDHPEALDEALADALTKPTWRDPDTTVQLLFLLADAPPQIDRQVEQPYDVSMAMAAERGIRIFPIASSDSDDQAEYVFRQLAQFTGSRFVFLSYGVGGAATGDSTDIESIDYEELPLEDLLVRLITEEVADLTGSDIVLPPSDTTTTTVDQ